jgi:tyrosyl-DNA phosphodiesterase 2
MSMTAISTKTSSGDGADTAARANESGLVQALREKRKDAEDAVRAEYCGVKISNEDMRLLTYNIWFGDVAPAERLEALGKVIAECDPHVLCLQEVTPQAMFVLRAQTWWDQYIIGPPPALQQYFSMMMFKRTVSSAVIRREKHEFRNSIMGRYLDIVSYMRDPVSKANFALGTSHLESYINARQTSAEERRVQIAECFSWLNKYPNAIFMGDTNWDDKDGTVPMPDGWRDAWLETRPEDPGYTYDAKRNAMLRGYLQKRLDRAFVKLKDFDVKTIEMVGTTPIPGVTYHKTISNRGNSELIELPVVPSDHFGLLLTITPKAKKASVDSTAMVDSVDLT